MKRFYRKVTIERSAGGFAVLLDGRAVKTAAGNPQAVGTQALAEALASEWRDQGEEIDPARFRFRDLADYAIDIVAPDRTAAIAKLVAFAETDTLCYRADPDDAVFRRQQELWEPLLASLEARFDVRFERVSGIIHRPQPEATLAALREYCLALDPFVLAALHALSSLAASLVIGLHALAGNADPEALWRAANLEEDWQAERWGIDAEAEKVRARRQEDFLSACDFVRLVGRAAD